MREHQVVISLKPEQFLEIQRLARAANAKSMGIFVRQRLLASLGLDGSLTAEPSTGERKQILDDIKRFHLEIQSFLVESLSIPAATSTATLEDVELESPKRKEKTELKSTFEKTATSPEPTRQVTNLTEQKNGAGPVEPPDDDLSDNLVEFWRSEPLEAAQSLVTLVSLEGFQSGDCNAAFETVSASESLATIEGSLTGETDMTFDPEAHRGTLATMQVVLPQESNSVFEPVQSFGIPTETYAVDPDDASQGSNQPPLSACVSVTSAGTIADSMPTTENESALEPATELNLPQDASGNDELTADAMQSSATSYAAKVIGTSLTISIGFNWEPGVTPGMDAAKSTESYISSSSNDFSSEPPELASTVRDTTDTVSQSPTLTAHELPATALDPDTSTTWISVKTTNTDTNLAISTDTTAPIPEQSNPLPAKEISTQEFGHTNTLACADTGTATSTDTDVAVSADTDVAVSADTDVAVSADIDVAISADTDVAISADTGTVVAADTGTVVAADTGTVVAADTGSVVAADTGTVVAADTGIVVSADTGTVVAADTGTVVSADTGTTRVGEFGVPARASGTGDLSLTELPITTAAEGITGSREALITTSQVSSSSPVHEHPQSSLTAAPDTGNNFGESVQTPINMPLQSHDIGGDSARSQQPVADHRARMGNEIPTYHRRAANDVMDVPYDKSSHAGTRHNDIMTATERYELELASDSDPIDHVEPEAVTTKSSAQSAPTDPSIVLPCSFNQKVQPSRVVSSCDETSQSIIEISPSSASEIQATGMPSSPETAANVVKKLSSSANDMARKNSSSSGYFPNWGIERADDDLFNINDERSFSASEQSLQNSSRQGPISRYGFEPIAIDADPLDKLLPESGAGVQSNTKPLPQPNYDDSDSSDDNDDDLFDADVALTSVERAKLLLDFEQSQTATQTLTISNQPGCPDEFMSTTPTVPESAEPVLSGQTQSFSSNQTLSTDQAKSTADDSASATTNAVAENTVEERASAKRLPQPPNTSKSASGRPLGYPPISGNPPPKRRQV